MDSGCDPAATTIDLKNLLETVQAPDNNCKSSKNEKLVADDLPDFSLAYLGPQLWNDTVMSDDLKLEPINLDDLLDDGSLSKDLIDISSILSDQGIKNPQPDVSLSPQNNLEVSAHSSNAGNSLALFPGKQDFILPSYNDIPNFVCSAPVPVPELTPPQAESPAEEKDASNFSYKPDLTDVMISTPMDESEGQSELFDPAKRVFTEEELKPQPIIRKAKKVYVPDDNKDAKYWQKREKNNAAAKRSRAARRIKENQIAMRTTFLEKENDSLRQELKDVRAELRRMIDVVKVYEARDGP